MKKEVQAAIDRLNPALEMHGGNIELVEVNQRKKIVYIRFTGACAHCSVSDITLNNFVGKELKKEFPELKDVIAIND